MRPKILCILLMACAFTAKLQAQATDPYALLCRYMSGYFNSEAQSKMDSGFFSIDLHMTHIWPERTDGYWLYVEQAMASNKDKPYRQRIYQVVAITDTTFESRVFEFDDPLQYAGAWNDTGKLLMLSPEKLHVREGCSIWLTYVRNENVFRGATTEKTCASNLRGASYASSEVMIDRSGLVSWDRGWDDSGNQVWGAVKGGYQFIKQHD